MTKYGAQASTANAILSRKGVDVTFVRGVAGTFDPVTQTEIGGSTRSFSMKGVGMPPGRSAEYRVGSLENRNVIEFHLAPLEGDTPQPGDTVTWAGSQWTIIWSNVIDPVGEGAVYALAYAER